MNGTRNRGRLIRLLAVGALALATLLMGPALSATANPNSGMTPRATPTAANLNPGVIPLQAHPYGHSYGEWNSKMWQWGFSVPLATNPLADPTGAYCGEDQSGPVWFLPSNFGGTTVRTCTIPPGKALLVLVLATECSTVEPPPYTGSNEEELRACAKRIMNSATEVELSVDGHAYTNLLGNYRSYSPLFTLDLPADNVLGVPAGTAQSVGDGYFIMLAPLPPGEHTIHMLGVLTDPEFTAEVTYHLTVQP